MLQFAHPPSLNFSRKTSSTPPTVAQAQPRPVTSYFPQLPPQQIVRSPSPAHASLSDQEYDDEDDELDAHNDDGEIPDVLAPGSTVGPFLLGEPLRPARLPRSDPPPSPDQPPAGAQFEVVRKLGTGSYAVVYLVREVLKRADDNDDHFELDEDEQPVYGRSYALKLLSKANLDAEALEAQLFEATVHQALPPHPNVVSLHRTLESDSYLLLLLEYVPGEDLFYFLEQARDHEPPSPPASPANGTPPTPGLLSSLHPTQLLSPGRLRLIASMFAQMCDAVAACHRNQVFHRDIKPENFIVTDGFVGRERKVLVKLSDFGLATTDVESGDMDCGSAPYMSYECRNNVAPTYRPRAADVWSLGIVLINMLYHCNPWTDTADGVCPSFSAFRAAPHNFLLARFAGMTPAVASFLAERVFCVLPPSGDDAVRVSARDFGIWVRDLPALFAPATPALRTASFRGHTRGNSISSIAGIGHALGSVPPSRRPSSRAGSISSPRLGGLSLSRAISRVPSIAPADAETRLAPVLVAAEPEPEPIAEAEEDGEDDTQSRTSTGAKRRKRGARKGRAGVPPSPALDTSELLASASQNLARELSRASRGTGFSVSPSASTRSLGARKASMGSLGAQRKPSMGSLGKPSLGVLLTPPVPPLPIAQAASTSPVEPRTPVKKASKWKLGFGSKSTSTAATSTAPEEPLPPLPASVGRAAGASMAASVGTTGRAANVNSLIMGLAPVAPPAPARNTADDDARLRARGRQPRERELTGSSDTSGSSSASSSAFSGPTTSTSAASSFNAPFNASPGTAFGGPGPARSPVRSGAASTANSWRSSMASTNSSASAFTRYSSASRASVSTYATSASAGSARGDWRAKPSAPGSVYSGTSGHSNGKGKGVAAGEKPAPGKYPYAAGVPPPNVKFMTGVPWELNELPRQLHPKPHGDIFGQPPAPRPARSRKAKAGAPANLGLGTISEGAAGARVDAGTSTTDLSGLDDEHAPKVQRGQINTLAKMLGALRR